MGHQKGNAIGTERSKWNPKALLFQLFFFFIVPIEILKKGDAQDKKSIWVAFVFVFIFRVLVLVSFVLHLKTPFRYKEAIV